MKNRIQSFFLDNPHKEILFVPKYAWMILFLSGCLGIGSIIGHFVVHLIKNSWVQFIVQLIIILPLTMVWVFALLYYIDQVIE